MALKADPHVIRAKHKNRGDRQMRRAALLAQYAIADLHTAGKLPQSPPDKIVTKAALIRLVYERLEGKLLKGELDRKTIVSAADDQDIKYRTVRGRPRR